MSVRSRYRSRLSNSTERTAILNKLAALCAQKSSRIVFEVGGYRVNASLCDSVVIDASLDHNNIQFGRPPLTGGKEKSTVQTIADIGALEASSVTTLADDGVLEVSDITLVADTAGSLNNTYFTFEDPAGTHKFYVWYNINSAGSDPALAGRTGIEVDGATGATASTLAGATRTALSAASTYFTISGSGTHAILTSKKLGNATDTADGAAPTGFTFTLTQGHAATRQSTYFTFSDALDAHKYYCWLNVNSEGVDPTVSMRTGVPIAVAAGASANTIATAIRSAIGALGSSAYFTTGGSSAIVTITNKLMGNSTDTADGAAPTGFTISTTTQGHASNLNSTYFVLHSASDGGLFHVWMNVNSQGVDPAPGGSTAIAVVLAAGASANTIASAVQSVVDAKTEFVATVSTNTVTITNATAGYATDISDGTAPTGFTLTRIGEIESYDSSDITLIKRLRTKKWLIEIAGSANHEFDPS